MLKVDCHSREQPCGAYQCLPAPPLGPQAACHQHCLTCPLLSCPALPGPLRLAQALLQCSIECLL
jgi:hypothetical protein